MNLNIPQSRKVLATPSITRAIAVLRKSSKVQATVVGCEATLKNVNWQSITKTVKETLYENWRQIEKHTKGLKTLIYWYYKIIKDTEIDKRGCYGTMGPKEGIDIFGLSWRSRRGDPWSKPVSRWDMTNMIKHVTCIHMSHCCEYRHKGIYHKAEISKSRSWRKFCTLGILRFFMNFS